MLIGLLCISGNAACNEVRSQYVSLQEKSCKKLSGFLNQHYISRDLVAIECPANVTVQSVPLRLFIVSSEGRSWIDLALGDTIWSSEDEVVSEKENQFGYFPNIGNTPAEIRINQTQTTGLIVRITAQNPEPRLSNLGASNTSRLFVFGFRDSGVCLIDLVRDNKMARDLLDSGVDCKRILKAKHLQ